MTAPIAQPKKRRRWLSWLLAFIIFISGGAVGAGLCAIAIVHGIRHALMHPEDVPERMTNRIKRPLDLTPDQQERVKQIFATHQQSLIEIRRQFQPQIEEQVTGIESDIATVLNPNQQLKWHAMVTKVRENWLPPVPPQIHPTTKP